MPGLRLANSLIKHEISLIDATAVDFVKSGENISKIKINNSEKKFNLLPERIILALGRFFAGGMEGEDGFKESLFLLPLLSKNKLIGSDYAGDYVEKEAHAGHELFSTGVAFDDHLRLLDKHRCVFAQNLYSVSSVWTGYDPARDGTGLAVAMLAI